MAKSNLTFFEESNSALPIGGLGARKIQENMFSVNSPEGQMRLVLPVAVLDKKNLNERIYPTSVIDGVCRNKKLKESMARGMMLGAGDDHPTTPTVAPIRASHLIVKAWVENIDGDSFMMNEWVTLGTDNGRNLRALLEGGAVPGVSIRGYGRTDDPSDPNKGRMVEYEYLGTDVVGEPSSQLYVGMSVPNVRIMEDEVGQSPVDYERLSETLRSLPGKLSERFVNSEQPDKVQMRAALDKYLEGNDSSSSFATLVNSLSAENLLQLCQDVKLEDLDAGEKTLETENVPGVYNYRLHGAARRKFTSADATKMANLLDSALVDWKQLKDNKYEVRLEAHHPIDTIDLKKKLEGAMPGLMTIDIERSDVKEAVNVDDVAPEGGDDIAVQKVSKTGTSDNHAHEYLPLEEGSGNTSPAGEDAHSHAYHAGEDETRIGGEKPHTHSLAPPVKKDESKQSSTSRESRDLFSDNSEAITMNHDNTLVRSTYNGDPCFKMNYRGYTLVNWVGTDQYLVFGKDDDTDNPLLKLTGKGKYELKIWDPDVHSEIRDELEYPEVDYDKGTHFEYKGLDKVTVNKLFKEVFDFSLDDLFSAYVSAKASGKFKESQSGLFVIGSRVQVIGGADDELLGKYGVIVSKPTDNTSKVKIGDLEFTLNDDGDMRLEAKRPQKQEEQEDLDDAEAQDEPDAQPERVEQTEQTAQPLGRPGGLFGKRVESEEGGDADLDIDEDDSLDSVNKQFVKNVIEVSMRDREEARRMIMEAEAAVAANELLTEEDMEQQVQVLDELKDEVFGASSNRGSSQSRRKMGYEIDDANVELEQYLINVNKNLDEIREQVGRDKDTLKKIAEIRSSFGTACELLESSSDVIAEQDDALLQRERELRKRERELEEQEEDIKSKEDMLESLDLDGGDQGDKIRGLHHDLRSANREMNEALNVIRDIADFDDISDLSEGIERLQALMSDMNEELEASLNKVERQRETIVEMRKEAMSDYKELKIDLDNAMNAVSYLREELRRARSSRAFVPSKETGDAMTSKEVNLTVQTLIEQNPHLEDFKKELLQSESPNEATIRARKYSKIPDSPSRRLDLPNERNLGAGETKLPRHYR